MKKKEAYGKCEKCGLFLRGSMVKGEFKPDKHDCKKPERGKKK